MHGAAVQLARLLEAQLALGQALEEGARLVVLDQLGGVGHDAVLAVGVDRLLDGHEGLVGAGLWLVLGHLVGGGGGGLVGGGLGLGERLGRWWRRVGEEVARHGVELDLDVGLGAVGVLEARARGALVVFDLLRLLLIAEAQLGHGLLEVVDRLAECREHILDAVAAAGGEDLGERVLGHRLGEELGDRDGSVERKEGRDGEG